MIKFEITRMLRKKHHIFMIVIAILIFIINLTLEFSANEINSDVSMKLTNLSQAVCQFTMLALIPIFSELFAADYQNKNTIFILQNNIDIRSLFLFKFITYGIPLVSIYGIIMSSYISIIITPIDFIVVRIIVLNLMTITASASVLTLLSLTAKRRTTFVGMAFAVWFLSNIVNSISAAVISGWLLPVDGQNNMIAFIANTAGKETLYKNIGTALPVTTQIIIGYVFWIAGPLFAGYLTAPAIYKKNSLK